MRRPVRLFWGLLLYCLALGALGAELRRHEVMVEGHPIRVWEKAPAQAGPHVLLLHGLTWSTRPNFDLQVPGETLSLMDGLNQHGIRAFGMDQRGYGETPRDASGWLDPEKAARDVIGVLTWMATQHPGAPAVDPAIPRPQTHDVGPPGQ